MIDIDKLLAGPRLDALIARHVFGKNVLAGLGEWYEHVANDELMSFVHLRIPNYSTDISAAWLVIEKLGKHAGDFSCCDGWFKLLYAESADHNEVIDSWKVGVPPCPLGEVEELEDGTDPEPWSCHFHLSIFACEDCTHNDLPKEGRFCAHGPTASSAICRAALKMVEEIVQKGE